MIRHRYVSPCCCACLLCAVTPAFSQWLYPTSKVALTPEAKADDRAGRAVALDGDNLVLGIPKYDRTGKENVGAVAVFRPSSAGWRRTALLTPSGGVATHEWGETVAVSGNLLVAGGPNYGYLLDKPRSGAAQVWERSGGAWTERALLVPPDAVDWLGIGYSLDVESATSTVVLGAPRDSDVLPDAGSVYIYRKSGAIWSLLQELRGGNPRESDSFGHRVALSGSTLAVATPYTDYPFVDDPQTAETDESLQDLESSGSVEVFTDAGAPGNFTFAQRILPPEPGYRDHFGSSVAIDGDWMVVGSQRADNDLPGYITSGAAWLFRRVNGVWTMQAKLLPTDSQNLMEFGNTAAISGSTVIVGAGGGGVGAAYVFGETLPGAWTQWGRITAAAGDRMGASGVAIRPELAVAGADEHDLPGHADAGAVFLTDVPGLYYPAWVGQSGLTGATALPGADADGDGQTNAQEYEARTDPAVGASVLRVALGGAAGSLSWESAAGVIYQIQRSTDLSAWIFQGTAVNGTGAPLEWQDPAPPPGRAFYRVEAKAPF
jgi:hypothetical protein